MSGLLTGGKGPPKPDKVQMTVETSRINGADFPNELIRDAGEKLCPDGSMLVASYVVHTYKQVLSADLAFICQQLHHDIEPNSHLYMRPIEGNRALFQLSMEVAKRFGWKPSKQQRKLINERGGDY
jgi:hypothetical protein